MYGQTASNLRAACGVEADTATRNAQKKISKINSPNCCNCKLAEGEKPHPANYRGCKLAMEEMLRRRTPQILPKNTAGRTFSSKPVTPLLRKQQL
jgi:hypothetical protein